MEVLLIVCSVFLFLLLTLPSLSSAADAYTLPTTYFINCGSADSVNLTSRQFVGDRSKAFSASYGKQSTSEATSSNSSSSVSELYRTARIFRAANSPYNFKIQSPGSPHFLRIHFSPFVSASDGLDLSDALFNVSVKGLILLSNYSAAGNGSGSSATTVEEFLLTVNGTELDVYFTPIGTSFAFMNALEVFDVPSSLVPDPISTLSVGVQGRNANYTVTGREVLAKRYRLNIWGPGVEADTDTLWRQWSNDSAFIQSSNGSNTFGPTEITYREDPSSVNNYTAPKEVYQTARNLTLSGAVYPNVTWQFSLDPNSSYVVRFHFCDIISTAENTLSFKLYLFDRFALDINPGNEMYPELRVPYKKDLVVESGADGIIKVGIGNNSESVDAYLNGIEIMEMIGSWDWYTAAPESKGTHTGMIIGIAAGGGVALVIVLVLAVVLVMRSTKRTEPTEAVSVWSPLPGFIGLGSSQEHKSSDHSKSSNSPLPNLHLGLTIPLSEILSATNSFDGKLMIGRGGFGQVYRGTLKDGTFVAVKRSEPGSSQGLYEFQTEIIVLSKIRHLHLVSLIGYCAERMEMILVYEFMEKGTLRDHLYNSDLPPLPWKQRLEICIGAARGLHYLHKGSEGGIIHRDVKSTNILLDNNYVAKVADFGLSKLGSSLVDQSQVSTGFKGTLGYLDPEYMKTQQLTEKSDVYAFGVVLLEVLCARPPIDPVLPREQMNLAEWGIANLHRGTLEDIVDPSLSGQINPNSLRKFAETAEKCLKEDDQERPGMGDVLWDLEYALQLQQSPVPKQLHEDSTMNGSSMTGFSEVQRLPSFSMSFVGDESMVVGKENEPDHTTVPPNS